MLMIEKEHKKSTLMSMKKEELVKHIMFLEHNNNVLNERIEIQARNCEALLYGKWIPVKERLPEVGGMFLIQVKKHNTPQVVEYSNGWNCYTDYQGKVYREHEFHDVVAWMPLPEPYKEEK